MRYQTQKALGIGAIILVILGLIIGYTVYLNTERPPADLVLTKKVFSWSPTFEVSGPKGTGTITQKIFSWGTTLNTTGGIGNFTAEKAVFSWGTKVTIKNEAGQVVSVLQKNVGDSLFKFGGNTFEIYNGAGKRIGTSEKIPHWLDTEIVFTDSYGKQARIVRPMNLFKDEWLVYVDPTCELHAVNLLTSAAFKSIKDAEEAAESDDDSSSSKKK